LQPFVLAQVLDEMIKPSADIIEALIVRQMHFLVLQRFIYKGERLARNHQGIETKAGSWAITSARCSYGSVSGGLAAKKILWEIPKEARVRGSEVKLTDKLPVTVTTPPSESEYPRTGEFFTMCRLVEAGGIELQL
jgi:hypothetical protein